MTRLTVRAASLLEGDRLELPSRWQATKAVPLLGVWVGPQKVKVLTEEGEVFTFDLDAKANVWREEA